MKSGSNLEKVLERGLFAVTAQLNPAQGNDVESVKKRAEYLRGYVDAVNVTDNQTAIVRMSSLATSILLLEMGLEPVMQVATRDRNRIAIQADIFGATALGVRNLLCLTGDHQCLGNQADSKNVFDLDSLQLIDCARVLRDEGTLLGTKDRIKGEMALFIGGAANPFGDPFEFRVTRLAKKIKAGVDFVQTLPVFDMDRFKTWMDMVRDQGLHEKVYIMGTVAPLQSAEDASILSRRMPGIEVPAAWVDRMARAQEPAAEGIKHCVEQIEALKEIGGVHGIHIMALEREEAVSQIIDMTDLAPRPTVA